MKKVIVLFVFAVFSLQGSCQPDKTFVENIYVKNIVFEDGTSMTTAPAGGQTVTWNTLEGKPDFATVATSGSYVDLVNKPPQKDLQTAIAEMQVLIIPKLTTAQITTLSPKEGWIVFNITDHVLQYYNGTVWKILITGN
jgi:hypothetical protein